MNGVVYGAPRFCVEDALTVAGDAAVDKALERIHERLDDIRSSQTVFAVAQATTTGKIEAMESSLVAMNQHIGSVNELRSQVVTLTEKVRAMESKELRSWVEGTIKAALGGGFVLAAQYVLK